MELSSSLNKQIENNKSKIFDISKRIEQMHKSVSDTATMLTPQEQSLLYLIAKEYFTNEGAIFDGGCCTGGCAQSFAKGLSERNLPKQTVIHAYELGEVNNCLKDYIKQHYSIDYNVGDSFIELTEKELSNCSGSEYIKLFAGDITQQEYPEKIEILFLDVCKIPEVNHAMVQLIERCIPGKTLIIQQDFKWAQTPWINISMGYLEEYLYPIECDIFNTQVFLLTKAIPREVLQKDTWYDTSLEEKLRYFSRTYKYVDIRYRLVFDQDRIPILTHHGLHDEAAVQMDYLNTLISLNPLPEGWAFTPPAYYSFKDVKRSMYELFQSTRHEHDAKHEGVFSQTSTHVDRENLLKLDSLFKVEPVFKRSANVIIFSTDDNYAPYCYVAISSLLINSAPDKYYDICILHKKLSQRFIDRFSALTKGKVSVRCVALTEYLNAIDESVFHINSIFTAETYYRFFIPKIFGLYEKALYLDCDMIFQSDMAKLFDVDMQGKMIAAVRDYPVTYFKDSSFLSYLSSVLNISDPTSYFNAGLLLLDIAKLNEENFTQRCFERLQEIKTPLYVDQCILNSLYNGRVYYLPASWNYIIHMNLELLKAHMSDKEYNEYLKSIEKLDVIHCCGEHKPWQVPTVVHGDVWWSYARQTSFYEEILFKNLNPCINSDKTIAAFGHYEINLIAISKGYLKSLFKFLIFKTLEKISFGRKKRYYNSKCVEIKHLLTHFNIGNSKP